MCRCVDPLFLIPLFLLLSLSLFASFSSGNDYVTGVYGQPRTGVTRIRSRFTQVARVAKQRRGRERECGGERERGMSGGEWANCIPVSERARGMGLRGCISCLLPGRKPPTKTLMSNVSDDNANPTPLSRSFHDHRVCSNSKTSEEEFSSFERTRIRDKESFYQNFLGRNLKIERTGEEGRYGARGEQFGRKWPRLSENSPASADA